MLHKHSDPVLTGIVEMLKKHKFVVYMKGARRCWHFFFFSSRRRHTRLQGDWSSDVCSSDLLDTDQQHPDAHAGFQRNRVVGIRLAGEARERRARVREGVHAYAEPGHTVAARDRKSGV